MNTSSFSTKIISFSSNGYILQIYIQDIANKKKLTPEIRLRLRLRRRCED